MVGLALAAKLSDFRNGRMVLDRPKPGKVVLMTTKRLFI